MKATKTTLNTIRTSSQLKGATLEKLQGNMAQLALMWLVPTIIASLFASSLAQAKWYLALIEKFSFHFMFHGLTLDFPTSPPSIQDATGTFTLINHQIKIQSDFVDPIGTHAPNFVIGFILSVFILSTTLAVYKLVTSDELVKCSRDLFAVVKSPARKTFALSWLFTSVFQLL
jgi:hypothetical protein